ncbi:class I SAM-dependent methyltransferase [Roseospirillum parvum]|uniref:NADH dehydrogenase [ubiquinone] 1 alpha subcomplex assembly factor 7 n=1 Tax=Roseospirillum parvum TaxID=83401 RepID=A0A1G8A110_9PROT|nr:SAM-dependent methyltransferase [Roseospirillum parvum]SDH14619.1 NADH dehydrogenase [ubiquinone] 1 alpha subcomplex assembly factor 7 [Roseospirillum parvum]
MTPLARDLARRIAAHGPLPLETVMAEAAAAYYADNQALGRGGDFITAPEISQMFGELIGLWVGVAWQATGGGPFHLVELGPGRGTLMADAWRALGKVGTATQQARVHLVETSPRLHQAQAAALAGLEATPTWHADLATLPGDAPLIVVANEFLDALPIRQAIRRPDGWHERRVGLDGERLTLVDGPLIDPATLRPAHRDAPSGAPSGVIAETCPAAQAVVADLARRLSAQGGAALIIDYGPATSAPGDSLQAVKRHAAVDPLDHLGEADLTAHVDFEALADTARAAGLTVDGPTPQGEWLQALGITTRAQMLARNATPRQRDHISSALQRLTDPAHMGHLFKVLTLTPA